MLVQYVDLGVKDLKVIKLLINGLLYKLFMFLILVWLQEFIKKNEFIVEININNSIIILSFFIIISNKRVNIKEIEIILNFI